VDVPLYGEVASETTEGDIGLAKKLPTGADVSVKLGLSHKTTEWNVPAVADTSMMGTSPGGTDINGNPIELSDNTGATLGITFKQPLLRGFGPDVTLAPVHRADLAATEATLKAQVTAEQLIRDLVKQYWDLAYSAYEVDVRQQAVELAKKQEELTHEQM